MTVYFIGAGPGDPELITVKGQRLLRSCPVILYAGSLVPEAVLEGHCAEQLINTAELHLEQIIELIRQAHSKGQDVALLVTKPASSALWRSRFKSSPALLPRPPVRRCWKAN